MSLISRLHHVLEGSVKDRFVELRTSTSMEELRRVANLENIPLERLKFVERLEDGEYGLLDMEENIFYRTAKDVERGFETYSGTIMTFEDPEIKKWLVANIGGERGITNGAYGKIGVRGIAGEVTYEQVLACKHVNFYNNQNIRRFNELEYFKNLQTFNFDTCRNLEEVSLPYMSAIGNFVYCSKLKKLTTRYGLDIVSDLFLRQTPSLRELDTSKWTCSTASTSRMFENCGMETLDLSNFDMSNVSDANNMFVGSRIKSIKQNWNLSSLNNGSSMFQNCTGLNTLDTSGWNLSSLNNGSSMFQNCTGLNTLDTSGWNLSSLNNGTNMFYNCTGLNTLDTSGWNLSSLNNGSSMFYNCTGLNTLDTSGWNLSSLNNGTNMFYNCTGLNTLDTSGWGMNKVSSMYNMFWKCQLLSTINTSGWGSLDKVADVSNLFRECNNLVSIDLSNRLEKCTRYDNYIYSDTRLVSMVGNHTETDNVRLFIGRKDYNIDLRGNTNLNLATINAVIRGVASSTIKRTLYLPEPVKSQVTEEYKRILENKNWIIQ